MELFIVEKTYDKKCTQNDQTLPTNFSGFNQNWFMRFCLKYSKTGKVNNFFSIFCSISSQGKNVKTTCHLMDGRKEPKGCYL